MAKTEIISIYANIQEHFKLVRLCSSLNLYLKQRLKIINNYAQNPFI